MQIQMVAIESLKPAEYNPRKWDERAEKNLKASIEEFGLVDPLIVNSAPGRENIVIGGHFRLAVAKKMEFKEVPVVYVSIPNISKEKELNIRLNKNLGEWDYQLLATFEEELLKTIGFESQEMDKILRGIKEDNFDSSKAYEEIEEPIAKLGDIFQLGEHRLMCGDSIKEDNVSKLMGENRAQMIFTDPPYNVDYDYTVTYVKGRVIKHPFHAFNDSKTPEEYSNFLTKVFENALKFTTDTASFYCWHASKNEWWVRKGLENANWYISQTIFWLKNQCTFSRGLDYLWITEPCYFGWKKGKSHFINKKVRLDYENIINFDYSDFEDLPHILYERRDKISEYGHPTQKPLGLAERAIKRHSNQDDIILDFFGGSGSTLLACEQMKRKCFMMEIDPKYCDVIIKRYEEFTGQKFIKINQ